MNMQLITGREAISQVLLLLHLKKAIIDVLQQSEVVFAKLDHLIVRQKDDLF